MPYICVTLRSWIPYRCHTENNSGNTLRSTPHGTCALKRYKGNQWIYLFKYQIWMKPYMNIFYLQDIKLHERTNFYTASFKSSLPIVNPVQYRRTLAFWCIKVIPKWQCMLASIAYRGKWVHVLSFWTTWLIAWLAFWPNTTFASAATSLLLFFCCSPCSFHCNSGEQYASKTITEFSVCMTFTSKAAKSHVSLKKE